MIFNDLKSEYAHYKSAIQKRWRDIEDSGVYLFGKQVAELEDNFCKLTGMKYAVSVGNATDALTMLMYSDDIGDVICPHFTAPPVLVALWKGIREGIMYMEVDDTYTMNKIQDIKESTVVAVDLFGNKTNRKMLGDYKKRNNARIILDCSQAAGNDHNIKADFAVFSFYPTKPLASMGDGGMICTNHKGDAEYLKKIRFYGYGDDRQLEYTGVNSRMDEWQAAVVNAKMPEFERFNEIRIATAMKYKNYIKGIKDNGCVYHQFPVQFNNREMIIEELGKSEIPYMIHYPHQGEISERILSLPIHPFLTTGEVDSVCKFLDKFSKYEY